MLFNFRQLLLVHKGEVGDDVLTLKQTVQKLYQAVLVYLLTEDVLESPISERVDEFAHILLIYLYS